VTIDFHSRFLLFHCLLHQLFHFTKFATASLANMLVSKMLVTCGKLRNVPDYNDERIRSSAFTSGPKVHWEFKQLTAHYNGHWTVHNPQFAQWCKTDLTNRKREEDT
jgi:hypothetical protein